MPQAAMVFYCIAKKGIFYASVDFGASGWPNTSRILFASAPFRFTGRLVAFRIFRLHQGALIGAYILFRKDLGDSFIIQHGTYCAGEGPRGIRFLKKRGI